MIEFACEHSEHEINSRCVLTLSDALPLSVFALNVCALTCLLCFFQIQCALILTHEDPVSQLKSSYEFSSSALLFFIKRGSEGQHGHLFVSAVADIRMPSEGKLVETVLEG